MRLRFHHSAPMCAMGALLAVTTSPADARPKPPPPYPTTVNCAAGQTIMGALADGYTVITVAGVCAENVLISIDNILLKSSATVPGSIRPAFGGALRISGADGVSVNDLTLETTGGGAAAWVSHAQASFNNVHLIGGDPYALEATSNSSVSFNGGSISGSVNGALANFSATLGLNNTTISDVETNGAGSAGGAHLRLSNTVLDGSSQLGDRVGVSVASGSSAEIANSTVIDFGQVGVAVNGGAFRMFGSTVSDNGGAGVFAPTYPYIEGGVIASAGASVAILATSFVTDNDGVGVALVSGSGGYCEVTQITGNTTNLSVSAGSDFDISASCAAP